MKDADLGTVFLRCAERYATRPFLVGPHETRSYEMVADRCLRLARGLLAHGLQPGDRVAVVLRNHLEYVEVIFGAACAGLVVVPINRRLGCQELAEIVRRVGAKILITEPVFNDVVEVVVKGGAVSVFLVGAATTPSDRKPFDALLSGAASYPRVGDVADDQLQSIYFTSGTTSVQKGVLRSHASNFAMALGGAMATPFVPEDAALYGIPLHGAGFYALGMGAMLSGARLVLVPDFDPDIMLALCERERVTHTTLSPTMWEMLRAAPSADTVDLSALRHPLWGGMPLLGGLNDRLDEWLPVPCLGCYGLTEATCVTYATPDLYRQGRRQSSGFPIVTMRVRIADENGAESRPGELGEVLLRGSLVMDGYLDQAELTADTLRDGWLHTGDLGWLDEDGALTVVDRKKDMIISGGENIYPAELEDTISFIPGVREVAVVGIPDPKWGQSVCAFVVGDGHVTADIIMHSCLERHAPFKKPRHIVFVDELPKNAIGKINKRGLRELMN